MDWADKKSAELFLTTENRQRVAEALRDVRRETAEECWEEMQKREHWMAARTIKERFGLKEKS